MKTIEDVIRGNSRLELPEYESSTLVVPHIKMIKQLFKTLVPYLRPYFISTSPTESITANAAKAITLRISSDIMFVWTHLLASPSAGTLSLRLLNPASGLAFSRSSIPSSAIAGNGLRPYALPIPSFFNPNSDIVIEATNTGGVAITPNVTLVGYCINIAELPETIRKVIFEFDNSVAYTYWLTLDTSPVTVTTTRTDFTMTTNFNGIFLMEQLLANFTTDFNVRMKESQSGHDIVKDGRALNIFGTGQWNAKVPYPLFMTGGSQLLWTLWTDSGSAELHIAAAGIQIAESALGIKKS